MNETNSNPRDLTVPPGAVGDVRKRILLITPENQEIHQVRRRQFNNFIQLTMPYLAGFIDEARYQIELVDEYNQHIPYERPVDLVAITVNTPNAPRCYRMAVSRTNIAHNFLVNLGSRWSLWSGKEVWSQKPAPAARAAVLSLFHEPFLRRS